MILHWHQKLSPSQRATLSIKKLSQARLDANKKTCREAKTTYNRPSRNAAQGSQKSCNSQLSRDRAEHNRNKAGKKGAWFCIDNKSWATANKNSLHNPSILKKNRWWKASQAAATANPPVSNLIYLSMAEVEQRKRKIKSCVKVLLQFTVSWVLMNHMI